MNEKLEKAISEICEQMGRQPKSKTGNDNWEEQIDVLCCILIGCLVRGTGRVWKIEYITDRLNPPWYFIFNLDCGGDRYDTNELGWDEVDTFEKVRAIADGIIEMKKCRDSLD